MNHVGAAAHIGRIGVLAAALGIGAAVFCGAGTAAAAPAESSSSSADAATPTDAAPSSAKDAPSPAEEAAPTAVTSEPFAPQKSRSATTSTTSAIDEAETDESATDLVTLEPPERDEREPDPVISTPAIDLAATVAVAATAADEHVAPDLEDQDAPTTPVDTPVSWTMAAAASRNTLAPTPPPAAATPLATPVIDPVTHAPVIATPRTPLLEPLQYLPIIGPLFVTPIVAFVNQIPVVSDLLHPLLGYPLQWSSPPGTPRPRDVMVTSFDGTQIYVHFMPAAGLKSGEKAATILQGPGLLLPGATNLTPTLLDGVIADTSGLVYTGTLRTAGYNVVTWDPRGEHNSGGRLEQDSPDFDAKDVSAIISWIATQPEARLDPGVLDPRIGMTGASYGGGIQLVSAASDPRIDAIVPAIAWNTLNTAQYKNDAFKSSWAAILTAGITLFTRPNPAILPATIYGLLTGRQTAAEQERLAQLGPGGPRDLVGKITAPTLLIQGTVDTLFSLQEADTTAATLIANGVPTKVIWFCGGHGLCGNLFDPTDGVLIQRATLAWLDRYVNGNTATVTGPQFEFVDQRWQYYASDRYPITTDSPVVATGSGGQLPLIPFLWGSGPLLGVLPFAASRAYNALNLTTAPAEAITHVVGAPQLTMSYSGTGIARHVYAQLVDDSTGHVLGHQITPIPVTLDGQPHEITIALEPVAHTLRRGQTVTLQLVASSTTYATLTSFGSLQVTGMRLSLPTADPTAIRPIAI